MARKAETAAGRPDGALVPQQWNLDNIMDELLQRENAILGQCGPAAGGTEPSPKDSPRPGTGHETASATSVAGRAGLAVLRERRIEDQVRRKGAREYKDFAMTASGIPDEGRLGACREQWERCETCEVSGEPCEASGELGDEARGDENNLDALMGELLGHNIGFAC
jgi:hypothetical protein